MYPGHIGFADNLVAVGNKLGINFPSVRDIKIDFSDIPELDEAFFKNAKLVKRQPNTEAISIRVDTETLEWFRATAKKRPEIRGYQTLINDVLRTYVTHQINNSGDSQQSST